MVAEARRGRGLMALGAEFARAFDQDARSCALVGLVPLQGNGDEVAVAILRLDLGEQHRGQGAARMAGLRGRVLSFARLVLLQFLQQPLEPDLAAGIEPEGARDLASAHLPAC